MEPETQSRVLKLALHGTTIAGGVVASVLTHGTALPVVSPVVRNSLSAFVKELDAAAGARPAAPAPALTVEQALWRRLDEPVVETRAVAAMMSSPRPRTPAPSGLLYGAAPASPERELVEERAAEISRSASAGDEFDNRLRAVIDLRIAHRAREIASSSEAGSDLENWLRAERDVMIATRAQQLADETGGAAGELDNWLRAEREVLTEMRAREIAASPDAGGELDNWLRAERDVLTALRAREIAASPDAGGELDNWLRAERDVRVALRAREIAASPEARGELDNWLRAEREVGTAQRGSPA